MRTRLHDLLNELLLKDAISFQSNLVNEIIYLEAGIIYPIDDEKHSGKVLGFNFSPPHWDKNEQLSFYLPKIKMAQLKQLLSFLHIPEDDYCTNSPLILSADFVFEVLIPRIIKKYETLKIDNDPLIAKCRFESQRIFARDIVDKMRDDVHETLEFIRKLDTTVKENLKPDIGTLYRTLMSLERLVPLLAIIGKAITAHQEIMGLEIPDFDHEELTKRVKLIKDGLATYKRYNCQEAFQEVERTRGFKM